jgi:hypothetical protein
MANSQPNPRAKIVRQEEGMEALRLISQKTKRNV